MDDAAAVPAIRAVSARLLPDCSIEVDVALPGWDEPQTTVIEQHADFLYRVGATPRAINLDGGDRTDELAREHIARHIARMGRRLAGQQRYEQYRQEQRGAPALAAYGNYAC